MADLNDYYQVFNASENTSLKVIKNKYRKIALKYQPYTHIKSSFKNKFINAVLVWDMIQKTTEKFKKSNKSREELFTEWQENDMSSAMDRAVYYCTLKKDEFEKIVFKGFSKFVLGVYIFFLVFTIFIALIPFALFLSGSISIYAFLFAIAFALPIIIKLFFMIKSENAKTRKSDLDNRINPHYS